MALRRIISSILVVLALVFSPSQADIGTAAHYNPRFSPTACYGSDPSQFFGGRYATAGDDIWENGAACGREYLAKCVSAVVVGTCFSDQMIQVRIIGKAHPSVANATLVLSESDFGMIANSTDGYIVVEYQRV